MNPANGKIIVRCNMRQKDFIEVGGIRFQMAPLFNKNYREKSPVLAEVIDGNQYLHEGQVIVCHHNHFYSPSPYFIGDSLYSIPFGKTVFGTVDSDGVLTPMCGNMLCDRVWVETPLPLPVEQRKMYQDRVIITNPGWTKYKAGQLLFSTPSAMYEIVYTVGAKEVRIHKIHEQFIVGTE